MVHGAECRAQAETAGILFLDADDEIFAAGDWRLGVLRPGIDFPGLEILQSIEAKLTDLHVDHVENFAGRNGKLAPDHSVFRFGITANFDLFDITLLAFINHKLEVHGS